MAGSTCPKTIAMLGTLSTGVVLSATTGGLSVALLASSLGGQLLGRLNNQWDKHQSDKERAALHEANHDLLRLAARATHSILLRSFKDRLLGEPHPLREWNLTGDEVVEAWLKIEPSGIEVSYAREEHVWESLLPRLASGELLEPIPKPRNRWSASRE